MQTTTLLSLILMLVAQVAACEQEPVAEEPAAEALEDGTAEAAAAADDAETAAAPDAPAPAEGQRAGDPVAVRAFLGDVEARSARLEAQLGELEAAAGGPGNAREVEMLRTRRAEVMQAVRELRAALDAPRPGAEAPAAWAERQDEIELTLTELELDVADAAEALDRDERVAHLDVGAE